MSKKPTETSSSADESAPAEETSTDSTAAEVPAPGENSIPEETEAESTQILPPIAEADHAESPDTSEGESAEDDPVEHESSEQESAEPTSTQDPGPVPPPPAPRERSARDARPLPWDPDAPRAGRVRPDADADRRREIILEKASAIEAATTVSPASSPDEAGDEEDDLYTYIPPYNLPSRDPDPPAQKSDLHRQIFVTIGAVASFAAMLWMFGAFGQQAILGGGALDELLEGWYSGEQALLSPDANFFWLWPVVVSAIIAHTVFQWHSSQKSTPRQQRSGWRIGLASLLMLAWTAAVYLDLLTVAVLAALAMALALMDAVRQFNFHTARNSTERRLTDATVGLFAGWALVLAMSSFSVWLTALGIRIPGIPALLWALIGLLLCIWVGAFYAMTERGRITIALSLGWGMFWLIFPRLLSDLTSVGVAIGAAMGAFIVVLATESRRHRINHAERRAAMGRPVEDII